MTASATAIVILGASGDLARRKLVPALMRLFESGAIGPETVIVGSGRSEFTDADFRARFEGTSPFKSNLFYHQGIRGLKAYIASKGVFSQTVFFMALPPEAYLDTALEIRTEGFPESTRLIIEKPFGYDAESARKINRGLLGAFPESSIYRIDHYLAKEAVLNILVFRLANSLFEPVWNSRSIESIQINAFETLGVESRGDYFDRTGIIRDMVQNHLVQLLLLTTMEPPAGLDAEAVRAAKLETLKSIRFIECHKFQYQGYRDEPKVAKDSQTETYAELKLVIDNPRWAGMPVYIRVGKALNRTGTEIGVVFKAPESSPFKAGEVPRNRIIFKIQPAEGIILELAGKVPGSDDRISRTTMRFCFAEQFEETLLDAYQRLIADALAGNQTLFVSAAETELSWEKIEPCLSVSEVGTYERKNPPESRLAVKWIDFENYHNVCT
jgi:glucose-6-phosphate 1-dehydrogenase